MQLPQGGQKAQASVLDHADLVVAQAQPANGRRRCTEKPEEKRAEGWATRLGHSPPVQLGVAEQILQLNSLDLVVVQVEFIQGLGEVCRDNE